MDGKHMFVIPTHRLCFKAVDSIILEMDLAISQGLNCFLAVIDNSPMQIYLQNDEYLRKLSKDVTYAIYHIGNDILKMFVSDLAKKINKDKKEIEDLLVPEKVDYGKIHNWIYICSIFLNAEYIHRRDSDCYVTNIDKEFYPVVAENKFLGKKINSVLSQLEVIQMDNYNVDEKVCIVGSDYAGNWNLDLHELKKADENVVRKILKLSNISDEQINKIIKNDYASVEYSKDITPAVLKNSFDFPYNTMPECGNISMHRFYRYIPNFIGEYGIGYDYFSYFMCFLFKVPIVFHKNRIMHIHDSRRYTDIALFDYWRGMYKNIMLDSIYTFLIEQKLISDLITSEKGIQAIIDSYNYLPQIIRECISHISIYDSHRILNSICNEILISSDIEKYKKIGYKLIEVEKELYSETINDFKKSAKLIELWKNIISFSVECKYYKMLTPIYKGNL